MYRFAAIELNAVFYTKADTFKNQFKSIYFAILSP